MRLSDEQIDELEKLNAARTQGEWGHSRTDMDSYTEDEFGELSPVAYVYRDPERRVPFFGEQFRNDSNFVAAAVNALPALLAEVRAARRVVEAVEGMLHQEVTGDPVGRSRARTKLDQALEAYDASTGGAP